MKHRTTKDQNFQTVKILSVSILFHYNSPRLRSILITKKKKGVGPFIRDKYFDVDRVLNVLFSGSNIRS